MQQIHSGCIRAGDPRWEPAAKKVVANGPDTGHELRARNWMPAKMAAVLIVDSYNDEAEMYAQFLRGAGAEVDCVHTPEEALEHLSADPPDVIVSDMVFKWSAFDGPDFVRAVRALPECATTNFIVLSGFTRPVDRQRARAAGADRFLVKPCAPDELRRHVDSAVWAHDRSMRVPWNWPD